ncbi:hypothetical protein ACM66Z_04135 [Sulfurovum sp. ST-21]|uniref:Uncharacterized protein n=1 Tax=Sulfurovum indicum TaxID=2779528 RepID=A0A7M1S676_9BACT|nr:hypothetical protein [Sulfurovum indicum]QOR62664.1 hypothetical protein IMZ28_04120 [Sulfurovum indicum]
MIISEEKNTNRDLEIIFEAKEFCIYAAVFDAMYAVVETMLYKMKKNEQKPFLVILVSAQADNLEHILLEQKRPSDILVKIDMLDDHYALICQDTKVDGGFHFSERLMRYLKTSFANDIYFAVMDIRSAHYTSKEIIFEMLELFCNAKAQEKSGEVVLRSLKR